MPEFLADGTPIATQDLFVDSLSLGPAASVRQISFSVLGANAVTVQAWRYTDPTKTKWILEPFTRVFAGQSVGVVARNCAGLRFANATAGKSSLIVAELDYDSDVELEGGSITSAAIDASGNITPPPAVSFNIQHNGAAIGTEPTLDFVDEVGGLLWSVVDDSGNTRVQITPAGSKPPTRTVISTPGSGTYTPPAGCKAILVELLGGGGGGGSAQSGSTANHSMASGGDGGNAAASLITSLAASYAFVVGAAGVGAAGGGTATSGGVGGDTSFGASLVVAQGGVGGFGTQGSPGFGAPTVLGLNAERTANVGDVTTLGERGGNGQQPATNWLVGGYGGQGAGQYGGAGAVNTITTGGSATGGSATGRGGGGAGGVCTTFSGASVGGGNGGAGLIVITEFY